MNIKSWITSPSAVSAMLLAALCGSLTSAQAAHSNPEAAQITALYHAFGKFSTMIKDWGFATFIEYGAKPSCSTRAITPQYSPTT